MTKRKEFIDRKSSELDKWKNELEELKHMAKETSGALKTKLDDQMRDLHGLRDEGAERLKKLLEASEHTWEGMKDDVEHTWKAFRHSVNYFKSHFKDHDQAARK